jgi:ABC-type bacteriocin/lantibiotic exporter with double-glycine peptidase domain
MPSRTMLGSVASAMRNRSKGQGFLSPSSRKPPPLLAILASCACAVLGLSCSTPSRDATLITVPFVPQAQTNHCGVIALAMAFEHFDVVYDTSALTEVAFIPALDGSTFQLLADAAMAYGLEATLTGSDPQSLRSALAHGCLPIVYIAPVKGDRVGHFVVVTGISNSLRHIRIHDIKQPDRWMRLSRLRSRTTQGKYPTLLLNVTSTDRTEHICD